jgi:CHAT domain-containing protein
LWNERTGRVSECRVRDSIVQPVTAVLRSTNVPLGSRIWWCPTTEFTSLPLHATGPYAKGSKNLPGLYVSSYTPTLGALLRSQQNMDSSNNEQPRLVAIGQAQPYQGKELPAVKDELAIVTHSCALHSIPYTTLVDNEATVEQVMEKVTNHHWVHLACHGHPNEERPLSSSFAMHDGPLELTHLLRADIKHPEFAFLSACHTASFNRHTPDEVIHLAAGMQFAGFRSVIGTLWAVDDGVVCKVVSAFYKELFAMGGLDSTRAAQALSRAMSQLQKDRSVPIDQRILFIHIGA